jgi:hypothetical protein
MDRHHAGEILPDRDATEIAVELDHAFEVEQNVCVLCRLPLQSQTATDRGACASGNRIHGYDACALCIRSISWGGIGRTPPLRAGAFDASAIGNIHRDFHTEPEINGLRGFPFHIPTPNR